MKKQLTLTALLFVCLACKALGQENRASLPVIGIEKSYPASVSPYLQSRIDSVVFATAARFNVRALAFQVAADAQPGQPSIALDFTKAKLATKKQRNIAYAVNVIAPVYIPAHTIKSTVTFTGPGAHATNETVVKSQTRVLLANISRREEKLLQKYADRLYEELLAIEATFAPVFASSAR